LTFLFPAGIYYCFSKLNDHNIFIILYGITSVYFAGVMVRLMLVLAPVMCILGGIAISASLSSYMKYLEGSGETYLLTIKTFTSVILTQSLLLRFRRINYD
jgi:dolichyl-diphosphooligosaccharide--protein glycosyltransferase